MQYAALYISSREDNATVSSVYTYLHSHEVAVSPIILSSTKAMIYLSWMIGLRVFPVQNSDFGTSCHIPAPTNIKYLLECATVWAYTHERVQLCKQNNTTTKYWTYFFAIISESKISYWTSIQTITNVHVHDLIYPIPTDNFFSNTELYQQIHKCVGNISLICVTNINCKIDTTFRTILIRKIYL